MTQILEKNNFPERLKVFVRTFHDGKRTITSDADLGQAVLEAFANGSPKVEINFSPPSSIAWYQLPINYRLHGISPDITKINIHTTTSPKTLSITTGRDLTYIRDPESDYVSGKKSS